MQELLYYWRMPPPEAEKDLGFEGRKSGCTWTHCRAADVKQDSRVLERAFSTCRVISCCPRLCECTLWFCHFTPWNWNGEKCKKRLPKNGARVCRRRWKKLSWLSSWTLQMEGWEKIGLFKINVLERIKQKGEEPYKLKDNDGREKKGLGTVHMYISKFSPAIEWWLTFKGIISTHSSKLLIMWMTWQMENMH